MTWLLQNVPKVTIAGQEYYVLQTIGDGSMAIAVKVDDHEPAPIYLIAMQ